MGHTPPVEANTATTSSFYLYSPGNVAAHPFIGVALAQTAASNGALAKL